MLLHEASGFLSFVKAFLDLIHAIGQRVIGQQIQTRQQAIECGYALFSLLILRPVLLVIALMGG
ncbi:Uncharacterised protein [Klebsiella pneumoniae]|nr:Uncharacterised protein [Klebsiella pneumoniae]